MSILNTTALLVCIAALSIGEFPETPPFAHGSNGTLLKHVIVDFSLQEFELLRARNKQEHDSFHPASSLAA